MNQLTVMNGTGDTEFKWNPDDPDEVAEMREQVEALKKQGFTFWLVDGRPADEVTAGNGTLSVRRINAEEVPTVQAPVETEAPVPAPRRRGRPVRTATAPQTEVVAHRPLRGG